MAIHASGASSSLDSALCASPASARRTSMGDFYTVPDAITFRNTSALGKNQSRTLLLKNTSNTDAVVFLSLPFTKHFSLECDSIQHEQLNSAATCIITKVPAGSSAKVVVRLHSPPDSQHAENLHDCLVVVMGKVPLLVPIRAVWQPLEPASGQCLEAILSQMDFHPPQKEIDEHCNAFVVELENKLQIGLQPPCAPGQPPTHQQSEVGMDVSMLNKSHGHRTLALGQQLDCKPQRDGSPAFEQQLNSLPPDTFSQAPPQPASGRLSSDEELHTPVEDGTDPSLMSIPKLDHRITIKGRTAYATRVAGTSTSAPLRESTQLPSASLPANAPQAHRNPPSKHQAAPPPASSSATGPEIESILGIHSAPLASPSMGPRSHGVQYTSMGHTLKLGSAVQAGASRPSSSSSSNSSIGNSCKGTPVGIGDAALHAHGTNKAAAAAAAAAPSNGCRGAIEAAAVGAASNRSSSSSSGGASREGSAQAQGPVFLLDGRWFNARGEEVGAKDGVPAGGASSMLLSLTSSVASEKAVPPLPHLPRHVTAHERPTALASAMRELGVHHLAPAPTSIPSTSTPFSNNSSSSIQPSSQLHTMEGCLTQLDLPRLPPSALPRRSTSLTRSSSNSLHDARSSTGLKQGRIPVGSNRRQEAAGAGGGGLGSSKGRKSRDFMDADDVGRDLESALEAHITQLTDADKGSVQAPQSSFSSGTGIPHPAQQSLAGVNNLGGSIPRPAQHTQAGANNLTGSRNTSSGSSTSTAGNSIPCPAQHTQVGVNNLSSRRASSGSNTSMAGSGKKQPAALPHAKPNSQAAGRQAHAKTHVAAHAKQDSQQPGRQTPFASLPASSHSSSISSNNASGGTTRKDGANKSGGGPAAAVVSSISTRKQQQIETAAKRDEDESEEDDGDGFAEQLAQAVEAQIHTQAAHAASSKPLPGTKKGSASGAHAAVKDDQTVPPRLGIPASHHAAAKGAMEKVRQQQKR